MSLLEKYKKISPTYRLKQSLQEKIYATNEKDEYLFWLSQRRDGETMEETKKRVFLSLPQATGDLRLIQCCLNYILLRVKSVCDKNNIPFMLDGGTLLGAVRHNGFIPWDDDVDIIMLKDDFDKFREAVKEDDEIELHLCYVYQHGALVRKIKLKSCRYLFVDIFILEQMDADIADSNAFFAQTQSYCNAFHKELKRIQRKCKTLRNSPQIPVECPEIDGETYGLIEQYRNKLPLGNGGYICQAVDDFPAFRATKGILPTDAFFPCQKILFEGVEYNAPANCDLVLSRIYGNYMSFPHSVSPTHTSEVSVHIDEIRAVAEKLGIHA